MIRSSDEINLPVWECPHIDFVVCALYQLILLMQNQHIVNIVVFIISRYLPHHCASSKINKILGDMNQNILRIKHTGVNCIGKSKFWNIYSSLLSIMWNL